MAHVYYNPNPKGANVGDCSVRAMSKALRTDWETAYAKLSTIGFGMRDMPSANSVWGAYLRENGFKRYIVDDHDQNVYTVQDFCRDNPIGLFVLAIQRHVVCVEDGDWYDTWDSGKEIPLYYWKRG